MGIITSWGMSGQVGDIGLAVSGGGLFGLVYSMTSENSFGKLKINIETEVCSVFLWHGRGRGTARDENWRQAPEMGHNASSYRGERGRPLPPSGGGNASVLR